MMQVSLVGNSFPHGPKKKKISGNEKLIMKSVKITIKSMNFPVLEKSCCAVGKCAQNMILNQAKLFRSWIALSTG